MNGCRGRWAIQILLEHPPLPKEPRVLAAAHDHCVHFIQGVQGHHTHWMAKVIIIIIITLYLYYYMFTN